MYLIPTQTWTPKLPLGTGSLFFPDHFSNLSRSIWIALLPFSEMAAHTHLIHIFISLALTNTLNRTGLRTEPKGACSVSLSILTPANLPLQSPWFRYAFLHGPFIHLPYSESHFPGDLGRGVKAQISKHMSFYPSRGSDCLFPLSHWIPLSCCPVYKGNTNNPEPCGGGGYCDSHYHAFLFLLWCCIA